MPDSEAKKKWDKDNVLHVTAKLFRTSDKDIIEYLKDKPNSTVIKVALREYMKNHEGETFVPPQKMPRVGTKTIRYIVIGGQHEPKCYGGRSTLAEAKKLAVKNDEYWDNRQGWHRPCIYAVEDTVEVEEHNNSSDDEIVNRVNKPDAEPVAWWDGKKWNTQGERAE